MSATDSHANPDFRLDGLAALVTGGGTHLGRAMAGGLAAHGAQVTVVGRGEAALRDTVERLDGGGHRHLVGDLTDDASFGAVAHLDGPIDILVNNAGGNIRKGSWDKQTPDDWRATYELNVVAPARLAQLLAPAMVERGWGRIINVASVYGFLAQDPRNTQPGMDGGAYNAAKHAVIGLTRSLAGRLGPHGVTVNAICPGMFPLPLDDPARAAKPWKQSSPELLERLAELTPRRRNGRPADLAGAVVYLASPAADFVTGHSLVVDGGWSVW